MHLGEPSMSISPRSSDGHSGSGRAGPVRLGCSLGLPDPAMVGASLCTLRHVSVREGSGDSAGACSPAFVRSGARPPALWPPENSAWGGTGRQTQVFLHVLLSLRGPRSFQTWAISSSGVRLHTFVPSFPDSQKLCSHCEHDMWQVLILTQPSLSFSAEVNRRSV